MLLFRTLVLLGLLVALVCFAFYVAAGDRRYLRWGWVVLKWALLAGLGFFAVLIAERML
ncbi:MAG: hypothetical protein Q4D74_02820 [Comamonadaceae bacterium]|nr:hypothetical protein [Comamonadaceae bacterium]